MSLLVASLYLLCIAFLFGSGLYVFARNPTARLNASFALLSLFLLGWVGSLFVFNAQNAGPTLLWLGRANFAAAALVAPAVFQFVRELARKPVRRVGWLWLEAGAVVLVSLLTGLIDRAENVLPAGEHITTYGPLFWLFIVHILLFVGASLWIAFQPAAFLARQTRNQLRLVGVGILVTALISVVTNAVLPSVFDDFRFIDAGTLSTIFFLGAVAYATFIYHLFDIRVIVRAALVFGLLIAVALEIYQAAVEFLTRLLPLGDATQRHIAAATVALIVNAFTHEPLRQMLERIADKLLSGKRKHPHSIGK